MKLTDYLAMYAAVLSTLVFLWNVYQSRPKIKIDLLFGVESKEGAVRSGVYIIVRNMSSHDIYLSNISILYPYGKSSLKDRLSYLLKNKRYPSRVGWVSSSLTNYEIEHGCPMCLGARQSHQVLVPYNMVDVILENVERRILIGCVQDQLWQNTYSSSLNIPYRKS
ncbi:hypothetical protein PEKONANI_01563 [Aeromonas jandaei]|uniref:hypothetical protein n=1 Tax=Aeromonas TaxID=642 RepID=UPI00191CD4DA|nr:MULTISPECIES: hypothetical protein [Aeromonas]MBL0628451.1 hypothetical protein [Aeromonas jandaei]